MKHAKAFGGACAVAIAAAVLVPAIFGQRPDAKGGGDPWRTWIYDFQTLITGVAAVTAATLTIRTMERTDYRQEKRHRELVELTLRADRLRIDRVIFPQMQELAAAANQVAEAAASFAEISISGPKTDLETRLAVVDSVLSRIQWIMVRSVWDDARPLFSGYLVARIRALNDAVENAENRRDRVRTSKSYLDSLDVEVIYAGVEMLEEREEDVLAATTKGEHALSALRRALSDVAICVQDVIDESNRLGRQYEIAGR